MKKYLLEDEWKIIEEGFDPENARRSESIFSLGNGHMGQRANFEEGYSGPSLQGTYLAGIYFPDKTRVGWWKNGYPEYFAKVLNAPSWIDIRISFNGTPVDLGQMNVSRFRRELDMKRGILYRTFEAAFKDGRRIAVEATRFLSVKRREAGLIRFSLTPLNFSSKVTAELFLNGDVVNQDSNYDEKFWESCSLESAEEACSLSMSTKKSGFRVSYSQMTLLKEDHAHQFVKTPFTRLLQTGHRYEGHLQQGQTLEFEKYVSVVTNRDWPEKDLETISLAKVRELAKTGFDRLLSEQEYAWEEAWKGSDIQIEGDLAAQQGIRFCIYQLSQTYSGHDPRLNIGPKGFTGEKYGGSTYWDTEAFCLPFYLGSSDPSIARNLLLYRYYHLEKAIRNAERLGFSSGAALFPMVTVNGEECHNEWEITFEEIHRNGAIAYAISRYIRQTGDQTYLGDYGLEVLIGLSRFWSQRFSFSDARKKFVLLGVTGPNEYENNVNNNWYTNYIATWTLSWTLESIAYLEECRPDALKQIFVKTGFLPNQETPRWRSIIEHVWLPEDQDLGVFLQQDGYLDKEQLLASDVPSKERPINQHWSWDRILRSSLIKQADVLQGLYFFSERFDHKTLKANFDFYEPRTVHESSLSACVHAILACRLGYREKAAELFIRSARLDLDDYNNEVGEGCHITSMGGTWMAAVEGFGGMCLKGDQLHFNPILPDSWTSLSFRVHYRGATLSVFIRGNEVQFQGDFVNEQDIYIGNRKRKLKKGKILTVKF